MRNGLCVLLLLASGTACYEFVPVRDTAPAPGPGSEVRAQLTSPQPFNLGPQTLNDITSIEGTVYANVNGNDSLALWSRQLKNAYGGKFFTNGNVFYIPREQIRVLETRRVNPAKTGLAAVLGAGALVGIVTLITGGGGTGPLDGGEGTETHVIGPIGGLITVGLPRE